ncbi:MAG: hypothetical protein GAK29_01583 [Acinetobacter bereziniae]|uniref:Uncharacterized protein n=1 Tax=Acinetobacter bereziniae TaxID=106648 RepID=A0A833PI53_ACIBZ|nr:MAG: hypothetical protein GAK29_01583 [Acinetobacter bereziniae]
MSKPEKKPKTLPSKKKLILIGGVFIVCALLLKQDAH